MVFVFLLLLAGAACAQTVEQSQGPLTVQARGGETPAVSGTLQSWWDPRTQARWKAGFETDRQVLELHVSRDLGSELEAVLHMTHEWRDGAGTPGAEVRLSVPVSAAWRAALCADTEGTAALTLAGPRGAVTVAVKAGAVQARVSRGWFTVEGSADHLQAGCRYRVGELSVGARARRTWVEDQPVDSLETDLLYRW